MNIAGQQVPATTTSAPPLKRYYTNDEFCQMMGINARTAWEWRKQGKIGFLLTPGGRIRYLARHIEEFEQRHEKKTRASRRAERASRNAERIN